jgi:hypothetical protein
MAFINIKLILIIEFGIFEKAIDVDLFKINHDLKQMLKNYLNSSCIRTLSTSISNEGCSLVSFNIWGPELF